MNYFLAPKEHVGRLVGRCVRRDSRCVQRQSFRTATSQPLHSTQVTPQNVSRSRWQTTAWLSVDRCWQPCSAATATRDVAWRATIDAGRLVPRESRIGTLDAHSCCVEVEHSLLEPVVDEQSIWRLSTPRPNWTIPFHPEPPKKGPGRGARRWRGPLASWVRAGLPRRWRSAPAPCPGAFWLGRSSGRTNRTSARLWCAYRAHPRCLGGPNTTGAPAFLNAAKMAA